MSKSNPCRESNRTLDDVTLRIVFSIPESRIGLNGWRRLLNPGRAAVFAALAVTVEVFSPLHYEMGGEAIYIHAWLILYSPLVPISQPNHTTTQ